MRSLRLIVPIVLVVLVAVALVGQGPRQDAARHEAGPKTVLAADVASADHGPGLWFPAVARADRTARLAFSIGGRLLERRLDEGDVVAEGQVVARLDVREQALAAEAARATVAEAEVRQAEARRDLARVAGLAEQGAATREELETLESLVDAAAAVLEAARARLADAERQRAEGILVAPYGGTVTRVLMAPGEHASAGRPVIEMVGDDGVEALLDVPQAVAMALEPSDAVAVRSAVVGTAYGSGRIVTIGRAGGAAGRLFPVIVALGDDVPVGASVEIALRAGRGDALSVPVEAVVDPAGAGPSVFRLRQNDDGTVTAERVAVSLGALVDGRVVVVDGLVMGDRVVVAGQRGLLDGDVVEVLR